MAKPLLICPLSCPLPYPILPLILLASFVSSLLSSLLPSALSSVLSWLISCLLFCCVFSCPLCPVLSYLFCSPLLSLLLSCSRFPVLSSSQYLSCHLSCLVSCSISPVLSCSFFCPSLYSCLLYCYTLLALFLSSLLSIFLPLLVSVQSFLLLTFFSSLLSSFLPFAISPALCLVLCHVLCPALSSALAISLEGAWPLKLSVSEKPLSLRPIEGGVASVSDNLTEGGVVSQYLWKGMTLQVSVWGIYNASQSVLVKRCGLSVCQSPWMRHGYSFFSASEGKEVWSNFQPQRRRGIFLFANVNTFSFKISILTRYYHVPGWRSRQLSITEPLAPLNLSLIHLLIDFVFWCASYHLRGRYRKPDGIDFQEDFLFSRSDFVLWIAGL